MVERFGRFAGCWECGRSFGFAQDDKFWGGVKENKQQQLPIQGSFTALRMTDVGVTLKRAVELCSIPHPLQKAQRVGHPELGSLRKDVALRTPRSPKARDLGHPGRAQICGVFMRWRYTR